MLHSLRSCQYSPTEVLLLGSKLLERERKGKKEARERERGKERRVEEGSQEEGRKEERRKEE